MQACEIYPENLLKGDTITAMIEEENKHKYYMLSLDEYQTPGFTKNSQKESKVFQSLRLRPGVHINSTLRRTTRSTTCKEEREIIYSPDFKSSMVKSIFFNKNT